MARLFTFFGLLVRIASLPPRFFLLWCCKVLLFYRVDYVCVEARGGTAAAKYGTSQVPKRRDKHTGVLYNVKATRSTGKKSIYSLHYQFPTRLTDSPVRQGRQKPGSVKHGAPPAFGWPLFRAPFSTPLSSPRTTERGCHKQHGKSDAAGGPQVGPARGCGGRKQAHLDCR